MNGKVQTAWFSKRLAAVVMFVCLVSSPASRAADNDPLSSERERCSDKGGTFTDLGGGAWQCCNHLSCVTCSSNGACVEECWSRLCCALVDLPGSHCFDWRLPSEHVGGEDGSWELGDADLVYEAVDLTDDATDGMIIIVGGHAFEPLEESALDIPVEAAGDDLLQAQIDELLMLMDLAADLDAGEDAETATPAVELLESVISEQPTDNPANDAQAQTEVQTAPSRPDHQGSRRTRTRR